LENLRKKKPIRHVRKAGGRVRRTGRHGPEHRGRKRTCFFMLRQLASVGDARRPPTLQERRRCYVKPLKGKGIWGSLEIGIGYKSQGNRAKLFHLEDLVCRGGDNRVELLEHPWGGDNRRVP